MLGVGYRLDHSPLMIAMEKGAEGHTLHGGAVTEAGEPAWTLAYEFRHGQMRNQLLTVCLQLSHAAPGDGGFCVVPGSHKANFPVPPVFAALQTRAALTSRPHGWLTLCGSHRRSLISRMTRCAASTTPLARRVVAPDAG